MILGFFSNIKNLLDLTGFVSGGGGGVVVVGVVDDDDVGVVVQLNC
jgi:hypothetical protein